MASAGQALQVVTNSATQSLVITLPNGSTETYLMTQAPAPTSTLVLAAKQDVLHDLSLESVLTDLARSVDLMFLAYCGVAANKLQADVNDRQLELMNLCGDCVTTMTGFKVTTGDILSRVCEAFHWLSQPDEMRAIALLSRCGTLAQQLSDQSAGLAGKFKDLSDATQKTAHNTIVEQAAESGRIDDLKQQQDKMQATLASLNQANKDLTDSVAEMQQLYDDAKEREAEADKRAFISSIVSGVTSAIGAGVGAFAAAENPELGMMNRAKAPAAGTPSDASAPDSGASSEASANPPAPNKALEAATATAAAAAKELSDATAALAAAQADVTAKTSAKDQAVKSGSPKLPDLETELNQAEAALTTAQARANAAQTSKKDADQAVSDAKNSQTRGSVASGVAAGAADVADTTRKMADDAQSASNSIQQEKMKLLDAKLQLEKQKRDVNSQIAELNASIGFNAEQNKMDEVVLNALQMAVWAFANIAVALSNAKLFWDNMTTFCGRLASPSVLEKLKDEQASADSPQARQAYYLSEWFLPTAVSYLARWEALNSISEDYVAAANAARTKSTQNIALAPSIEQAQKMLGALKDKIAHQLDLDRLQSTQRSDALMGEMKLLAN